MLQLNTTCVRVNHFRMPLYIYRLQIVAAVGTHMVLVPLKLALLYIFQQIAWRPCPAATFTDGVFLPSTSGNTSLACIVVLLQHPL